MKNWINKTKQFCLSLFLLVACISVTAGAVEISKAYKINPTTIEILYSDNQRLTLDFYGDNIFRLFQDRSGGIIRDPQSMPEAKILVSDPRYPITGIEIREQGSIISIITDKIEVLLDKNSCLMKVRNLENNTLVLEEMKPILFEKDRTILYLKEQDQEYFYGGGVQNGRFSHKGKKIAIENQNSWTDGGVASPNPYYWSTKGYGFMWHTFKRGQYDFGANEKGIVELSHEENYLDVFFMINTGVVNLLNDYYQLTGQPVLLPKFGFYQGHLNAYNRDYWKEDEKGVLFEDGKHYKESQKDKDGIKESLNGELNNYQFSARAVIDRYKAKDMPFGWLLPNDGYGAGYGQTETLDGNIQNLRNLTEYAHQNGVEIGLWTQSDLHPKPEVDALLQRDIVKEVRDAGVRVLKTDVAWVGAGYSFGLNGITDVSQIMTYYGNNSRPFIITLDGWAGTQRYAGIWSGDQTGGVWEYIRFHIPTYIGSGLSGNPNISSDMDGIFGGNNFVINTRDFQWKTFTPMQLNMDGWGANEKYPHALGEPATSINRNYLKLRSELMPYIYSKAKEAVDGMPMVRAMFLEDPNTYTLGKSTQYQFMFGSDFLIAPIYKNTQADEKGNDIRDGIYLPKGEWIDYFTGDKYIGGCLLNNFDAPLWKLPVFVKNGAIIPMVNPNNNVSEIKNNHRIYEVYPHGSSSFVEYDDDGRTEEYREGKGVTTLIEMDQDSKTKQVKIIVYPTQGEFDGFLKDKSTEFRINVTEKPKKLMASIGKTKIKLTEVQSMDEFLAKENVYFYCASPNMNKFASKGSEFEKVEIIKNPLLYINLASIDITVDPIHLTVDNFVFNPTDKFRLKTGSIIAPSNAKITETNIEAYTLMPSWEEVDNADFYEIDFEGMLYTGIRNNHLVFENLIPETTYTFKLRSVNKSGSSDWTSFSATTKSNPLEFAIKGIIGETSASNQGRSLRRLFDFDEGELWHTKYGENALPFDLVMDLKTINQLDKFHYIPRDNAGNGTILKGSVYYGSDKENWTEAGAFEWTQNNETKLFQFTGKPTARYIKINITEAIGGYGSGKEIYVFKVPGTESYLPGDINNDGKIDENDLISYTNYTGLRKGDADFEGYISNGDINKNNLIEAYDISVVATQLEGGIDKKKDNKLEGHLELTAKQNYNQGEIIEVRVKGVDLSAVNALSFALPYNPQDYDFMEVEELNTKEMRNLTNNRLHTDGTKALYPTFVNVGTKDELEGTSDLFILKFKAKRKLKFNLKPIDILFVDKDLNTLKF